MRSARWQSIADLPIGAHRGLQHHRRNREGVVPIFIGRGAPLTLQLAGISKFAQAFAAVLPEAFVGGRWNVALKVHSVVEDTHDFDRAA